MCYYVYADHAQYTIKTYAKMSLFALDLTGPLSSVPVLYKVRPLRAAARSTPEAGRSGPWDGAREARGA